MILGGQIIKEPGRLRSNAGCMNIGLSMGRGDSNADVFQRAAEASHSMPLEMGQHQDGIIVGQMLAHNILLQMKTALHRDIHLTEFIHDITGSHGLESVIFDGLPMLFGVLTLTAVGRTALDNRAVELPHQTADQFLDADNYGRPARRWKF